jgi:hypothetical protein
LAKKKCSFAHCIFIFAKQIYKLKEPNFGSVSFITFFLPDSSDTYYKHKTTMKNKNPKQQVNIRIEPEQVIELKELFAKNDITLSKNYWGRLVL